MKTTKLAPLTLRIADLLVLAMLLGVEMIHPNWLSGAALVCVSVVLLALGGATPHERHHAHVHIKSDVAGFERLRRR